MTMLERIRSSSAAVFGEYVTWALVSFTNSNIHFDISGNVDVDAAVPKMLTEQKPYECEICGRRFTDLSSIKEHLMTKHSNIYPCQVCGMIFTLKMNMIKHLCIHTGAQPFKCDVCNKRFNDPSNMKNHMCSI